MRHTAQPHEESLAAEEGGSQTLAKPGSGLSTRTHVAVCACGF